MASVERIFVRLIGDATQFEKTMRKASARISAFGKKVGAVGRSMSLKLTAPLSLLGGIAVKTFADFDSAMVQSTAIMGNLDAMTKQTMADLATEMSERGVKSATELAESYYFLASAGLDAEQSMAALPIVTDFATAGMFDMAMATDLLTDAQSALGLEFDATGDNMTRLGDTLIKASTLANASVQQFSEAMTNDAATAARSMGIELETVTAVLALYADKGKKGAEAGSMFGRATRLLAASFTKNADEFEKRGIRVIDEATGEYRNFIDVLADMEKAFDGLTGPQRSAALEQLGFAALAQKSIVPLLGMSEKLKEYENELKNVSGMMAGVVNTQLDSFSSKMKILRNQITNAAREIGEQLAPIVGFFVKRIAELGNAFKDLSPAMKQFVVIGGILLGVIGPLLVFVGALATGVASMFSVWAFAIATFGKVALVTAATTASLAALKIMVLAVAAAVVYKLVIAFAEWASRTKELKEEQKKLEGESVKMISKLNQNSLERLKNIKDEEERMKALTQAYKGASVNVKAYTHDVKTGQGKSDGVDAQARLNDAIAYKEALEEQMKAMGGIPKAAAEVSKHNLVSDEQLNKFNELKTVMKSEIDLLGKSEKEKTLAKLASQNFNEEMNNEIKALIDLKTAREAEVLAQEEAKQKKEQLEQSGKNLVTNLGEQILMIGKSAEESNILKAELEGVDSAYLDQARTLTTLLVKEKEREKLMKKGEQLTKSMRTAQQVYNEELAELEDLFAGGHISEETYTKAIKKAREELGKDIDIKINVSGLDAMAVGSKEAMMFAQAAMQNAQVGEAKDNEVEAIVDQGRARKEIEGTEENQGTDYLQLIYEALIAGDLTILKSAEL